MLLEQRSQFSQTGYVATWDAEDWSQEGRPDEQGLPFLPYLFSDSPTTNVIGSIHLGLWGDTYSMDIIILSHNKET